MEREIKLLKNNDRRNDTDVEWLEEFKRFLQGEVPEGIVLTRGHKPKLSNKQAVAVIWYLQEHFPILPDHIEQCYNCQSLFDTNAEGTYWETKYRHYCSGCMHLVPYRAR